MRGVVAMSARKKKMETSKSIVVVILILFGISMAASYTLPVLFDHVRDVAQEIFKMTSTLTGSVLIGYQGKAGFENYDKNKKLLRFEEKEEEENEDEGGNG